MSGVITSLRKILSPTAAFEYAVTAVRSDFRNNSIRPLLVFILTASGTGYAMKYAFFYGK